MLKALLFGTLAAVGNGIFVYGQRAVVAPENPFLFVCGAVFICLILFLPAAMIYRTADDVAYDMDNKAMIAISGFGFFLTYVGFFLLYTNYGAAQYTLYAAISIVTTSLIVGVMIYREDFNVYKAGAMVLAIAAIALWTYGNAKAPS